jgi:hypothetical protein
LFGANLTHPGVIGQFNWLKIASIPPIFTTVGAGTSNAIYIVHTEFEPTLKQTIKYVKLKRSVQLEELG